MSITLTFQRKSNPNLIDHRRGATGTPKIYESDYERQFVSTININPLAAMVKVTKVNDNYDAIAICEDQYRETLSRTIYSTLDISYLDKNRINIKYIKLSELIQKGINKVFDNREWSDISFQGKEHNISIIHNISINSNYIRTHHGILSDYLLKNDIKDVLKETVLQLLGWREFIINNSKAIMEYFKFQDYLIYISKLRQINQDVSISNISLFRGLINNLNMDYIKNFLDEDKCEIKYPEESKEISNLCNFLNKTNMGYKTIIVNGLKFSIHDKEIQLGNLKILGKNDLALTIAYLCSCNGLDEFMDKLRRLKLMKV